MRPRQRKDSLAMVKRGRVPGHSSMALGAVVAEIIGYMIGISDSFKSALMAGITIRWSILIAIGMTGDTL